MDCVYIIHSEKLRKFYIGYTSNFEVQMLIKRYLENLINI